MAKTALTAENALSYLYRSIPIAVGMAFEGQCTDMLEPVLPNFITGAEGSSVDCGLVEISTDILDPDERLSQALLTKDMKMVGIDFKTINPRPCALWKGGIFDYCIEIKAEQVHCSAFIIQNPASSHLVALVPHYVLDHNYETVPKETRKYYTREAPFLGTPVNPFPMEWSPFVMHIRYLPEAVISFTKFSYGEELYWKNPHNGLEFADFPRPRLQNIALLAVSEQSSLNDFPLIEKIRRAINSGSNRYGVAGMKIRSKLGDFQFVHRATLSTAAVEIKQNLATITATGNIVHIASNYNSTKGTFEVYFHAMTIWDWLFTTVKRDPRRRALLINRKDLPTDWFKPHDQLPNNELYFECGPKFIEWHTVSMQSHQTIVTDIERILDSAIAQSKFQALTLADDLVSSLDEYIELPKIDANDEMGENPASAPRSDPRGEGEHWSQRMYETAQEDDLGQQCLTRGYGSIFRLGMHPSATHVFTPVSAATIFDVNPMTPMLYINFAPININLQKVGSTDRKRATLYHATHGLSRSLYILDPLPDHIHCPLRDCLLVPSEALNTAGRSAIHKAFLTDKASFGHDDQLYLSHHELIDLYAIPYTELIPQLRRFFSQLPQTDTITIGRRDVGVDIRLKMDDYLKTQKEVLAEFVPLLMGTSFWGKRGRSKGSVIPANASERQ